MSSKLPHQPKPAQIRQVLGSCVFLDLTKIRMNQVHCIQVIVTKNAWVKEFLPLCSKNRISWILKLLFEIAHEWKITHHWKTQEPRTWWSSPCVITCFPISKLSYFFIRFWNRKIFLFRCVMLQADLAGVSDSVP